MPITSSLAAFVQGEEIPLTVSTPYSNNDILVFSSSANAFINSPNNAGGSGEANTGSSLGSTVGREGVFASKVSLDLQFKSLVAGSGISLSSDASEITITNSSTNIGDITGASNTGAGSGIWKDKSGNTLRFKSLVGGTNITLSAAADTVSIAASTNATTLNSLADTAFVKVANNLNDVTATTARTNLSVYSKVEADAKYILTNGNTVPNTDNAYDIGGSTKRYGNIYAQNFVGESNTVSTINGAGGGTIPAGNITLANAAQYFIGNSRSTLAEFSSTASATLGSNAGVLYVDSGNSNKLTFKNASGTVVLGSTVPTTLNSLTDVSVGSATDGQVLTYSNSGSNWVAATVSGGGSGEANTASNVGTAGVGVYDSKVGATLRFKKINTGSTKVTVTDDAGNDEIDIDIVPAQIATSTLNNDANFIASAGAPIQSVNTLTGAVVLTTANVAEGTNLYYTDARWDTRLGTKSTANLTEGSNLYYTNARADARITNAGVTTTTVGNWNTAFGYGNHGSAGYLTAASGITSFSDVDTTSASDNAKILYYNHATTSYKWKTDASGTGTVTSITAGAGLTGGTITASGTIAVDVGTTANKIVQLDGSARLPAVNGSQLTNLPTLTDEQVQDKVGAMFTGTNTETLITATYQDSTGDIDLVVDNNLANYSNATSGFQTQANVDARIGAASINALSDVTITTPATNALLQYNGSAWIDAVPTTAHITEGANLYYTDARADARIGVANINALANVHTTAPTDGQVLKWDNSNSRWAPATDAGGIALTDLSVTTASAGTAALAYNNGTGVFTFTPPNLSSYLTSIATNSINDTHIDWGTGANQVSTADIPENTNLYYTDARADARITAADTGDLSEGSNLYYTNARADARIGAASIGDLLDVDTTSIANGKILKYNSGTSKWIIATDETTGGGVSTFVGHADTPASYAGSGSYFLKVNSGATALEFVATSGAISNVIEDTTPQLGGNLDANSKEVTNVKRLEIVDSAHTGSSLDISNGAVSGGVQKTYVLHGSTTNNTQTEIFVGAQGTSRMGITSGNVWMFEVDIIALKSGGGSEQAGWKYAGMIHNVAGTTSLTSNLGEIEVDPQTNWSVDASADNTNDALVIKVTGENSKTIKWVAFVKTTQLS